MTRRAEMGCYAICDACGQRIPAKYERNGPAVEAIYLPTGWVECRKDGKVADLCPGCDRDGRHPVYQEDGEFCESRNRYIWREPDPGQPTHLLVPQGMTLRTQRNRDGSSYWIIEERR